MTPTRNVGPPAASGRDPVAGAPAVHFTESRFGEAPTAPNGGRYARSGYLLVADPKEGVAAHAVATMARYKRDEPPRR